MISVAVNLTMKIFLNLQSNNDRVLGSNKTNVAAMKIITMSLYAFFLLFNEVY